MTNPLVRRARERDAAKPASTNSGASSEERNSSCRDRSGSPPIHPDDFLIVLPYEYVKFTKEQIHQLHPPASSNRPLFIYGSLLIPHILHRASGYETPMVDLMHYATGATLYGYCRHALRDVIFPAIVPNAEGIVSGAVVVGLSDEEKEAVKQFEGGMYDRVEVDVEVELAVEERSGYVMVKTEILKADTYVWNYTSSLEIVPVEEREWTVRPLVREAFIGVGSGHREE
jgi:Gamma-glutamyl cyclotransferase, AIG2-like